MPQLTDRGTSQEDGCRFFAVPESRRRVESVIPALFPRTLRAAFRVPIELSRRRALAPENELYSGENGLQQTARNVAGPFGQEAAVDRDNLRDVRYGVLGQSGRPRSQAHVAGRNRKPEVARQRDCDDRRDVAPIERVALHDQDGPSKAGARAGRLMQICPEDVPLGDDHSPVRRTKDPVRSFADERIGSDILPFVESVESCRHRRRVVASDVFEQRVAVEPASGLPHPAGELLGPLEYGVGNGYRRFHTISITDGIDSLFLQAFMAVTQSRRFSAFGRCRRRDTHHDLPRLTIVIRPFEVAGSHRARSVTT